MTPKIRIIASLPPHPPHRPRIPKASPERREHSRLRPATPNDESADQGVWQLRIRAEIGHVEEGAQHLKERPLRGRLDLLRCARRGDRVVREVEAGNVHDQDVEHCVA